MKHFIVAIILGAAAATGLGGPVAFASNGATHAKFAVTYPAGPQTTWACSGKHLVNHGIGTRDKETCLISGDLTGYVVGNYASDPSLGLNDCPSASDGPGGAGVIPPFGTTCWLSDYNNATASSWNLTFTDNHTVPDTLTLTITAYYNQ